MGLTSLVAALRLSRTPYLAITGSGGKTTALFQIAGELPPPVLVSTTTHMALDQIESAGRHFTLRRVEDLQNVESELKENISILTGPPGEEFRVTGLAEPVLGRLHAFAVEQRLPLLIEADGSRQKPLKAEAPHEPAVPAWAEQVLLVVGLTGLGKPLTGAYVHRPELFSSLSGIATGDPITLEGLEKVITSPNSGLKGIPGGAKVSLLLNQADSDEMGRQAEQLASRVIQRIPRVVIASLANQKIRAVIEPAAGIVLAAGASRRMGKTKQLLEWQGKPFVRRAAETALRSGLDPVIVVTGFESGEVEGALSGLPVKTVFNPDWAAGQSTSLAAGLRSLPEETGSAVFLLADQPQVTAEVIRMLVEAHAHSLAEVMAPGIGGKRANPVLFDRAVFPALTAVSGDVGGRGIFTRHPVTLLKWEDERLLMDVDTPEDYERLLRAV